MYTAAYWQMSKYYLIEVNIAYIDVVPLQLPAYIFHSAANETDEVLTCSHLAAVSAILMSKLELCIQLV